MADDGDASLSPVELWRKAGNSVPADTTKGQPGSQEQIQHATGTPSQAPAEDAPKGPPATSSGMEDFDRVMGSVWITESGNRHRDAAGNVTLGPPIAKLGGEQARGVSQILASQHPGVDVDDEATNRELGKKELRSDFERYGNWPEALMAYDWGPGNVDNWIREGKNPDKVPGETRKYLVQTLGRLGMTVGSEFVSGKDQDPVELWKSQQGDVKTAADVASSKDDDALVASLIGTNNAPVDVSPEGLDEGMSMTIGARNGLRDLIAGPLQAALTPVAPETAKALTDYVNKMDEPFERQTTAHPYAYAAGNILGTTIGIYTLGRAGAALGTATAMTRSMTMALRSLPSWMKAMGWGSFWGGTTFNKDPESSDRLAQTILGATIGLAGQQVGKAIGNGIKNIGESEAYRQFVDLVKRNYQGMSASYSKIKDDVLSYYERTLNLGESKYTVRSMEGTRMTGYPSGYEAGGVVPDSIAQLVQDVKAGKIGFDDKTGRLSGTASKVESALGLDEQRRAFELWQQRQKDFEEKVKEWDQQKLPGALGGGRMADLPMHQQQQMVDKGLVSPRPTPPAPFEPKPISPPQMQEARRAIEAGKRGRTDAAVKRQHTIFKQALDEHAARTAREAGMKGDINAYERAQDRADSFWRENVVPARDFVNGRSLQEARDQMDPSHFYDEAVRLSRSNNRHEQERFNKMLSPRGREEVRKALFHNMLDGVMDLRGNVDPQAIARYIKQHRTGFETMLGREEAEKLVGLGRIAEGMTREMKASGFLKAVAHHSWLLGFAAIAAFEGHFSHALSLGATAVGVETLKAGFYAIQRSPRLMALMTRAARATPKQLEDITRQLDTAMGIAAKAQEANKLLTKTGSRLLPQATGGEPFSTIDEGVGEASSMFYSGM